MSEANRPSRQSAPEQPEQDLVARPSSMASEAMPGDLLPVAELIALERERIASQNRRTDIARRVIDASDAADKRQYEYHREKLLLDDADRKRRHASDMKVVWTLFASAMALAVVLFWMIFAGDDTQRTVASELLETIVTGLGGFGVGWALLNGIRRTLSRS